MISGVSDYRWVIGADVDESHRHGDMDRISIDGSIMPLRTGDTENVDRDGNPITRKDILCGEDITFLQEASQERALIRSWSGATDPTREFSRRIVASQVQDIYSTLHGVAQHAISPDKPLTEKTWVFKDVWTESPGSFPYRPGYDSRDIRSVVECEFTDGEIEWPDKNFESGDPIRREPIERLFTASNKLRIIPAEFASSFETPYTQNANGPKVPQDWIRLADHGD